MVSLDVRPSFATARAASGGDGRRTEWLVVTGAAAAALGAAVAMALLSAVTVLLWACGPLATDGLSAAPFRGAASLWLLGQRAPLDTGVYDLVLPPLLVTAVVAVLLARLAGWAARTTSAYELTPAAVVGGGVVLGQVGVAALAGWVSDRAGGGVGTVDAMRAAAAFALPCALAGIAPQTWVWAKVAARWGAEVRVAACAAGRGALALAAGGALVLCGSLVVHHRGLTGLFTVLGGGLGGAAGTFLLCLALAPNAILWVVALAAGPGFALGSDGGLSLTGEMHGGALPAMPLLAALPGAGPLPAFAWVLVAIPVGAGAVIGWYARPAAGSRGPREELTTAVVAAVVCGLGTGLLAGLSGGGAGGRLADVGPDGLLVGALLALELGAAAFAVTGGRIAWERYRGPNTPAQSQAQSQAQAPTQSPDPGKPAATGIPRQQTDSAGDAPAERSPGTGSPGKDSPATAAAAAPIEVVEAAGVADLALEQHPDDADGLEDTQEFPVLVEDERED